MDSKFLLFPKLPREIQADIWDAAVRPVPGRRHVQKFIIADHYFNHANPRHPVAGRPLKFTRRGRPAGGYSLAVPWDDPYGGPNDSVSKLDSGLWMACTQSRAAMERRFKKNEWWLELDSSDDPKRSAAPGKFFGQDDVTYSASYVDRDGERSYITLAPDQDLFYLDARYLDAVDWFHHYAGDYVPLLDYRNGQNAAPKLSFIGLNIAVDYDPRMLDTLAGRPSHYCRKDLGMSTMSLIDMVDLLYELAARTLWVVDHRLRPISKAAQKIPTIVPESEAESSTTDAQSSPNDQEVREAFYSGSSVLVEVRREDLGTSWIIDTEHDESDNGERSAFDFFDSLFEVANGALEIGNSDRMRVLAYQTTSDEARKSLVQLQNAKDPSCLNCFPKEEVRRVRHVKPAADEDSDISLSDCNLFD
ncbi:hypothetical protein QQX98_012561 [Neonectria punicea]|uniref:Uncharacterized protein n=1 Tax=Neonectria punicea TaxID=979145 RepID=A0ABR1GIY2_9HYPO